MANLKRRQRAQDGFGREIRAVAALLDLNAMADDDKPTEAVRAQPMQLAIKPTPFRPGAAVHQIGDGLALDGEQVLRAAQAVIPSRQCAAHGFQTPESERRALAGVDDDDRSELATESTNDRQRAGRS